MTRFQLILNPIRDWNNSAAGPNIPAWAFQLILNPIRDWNRAVIRENKIISCSN